MIDSYTSSFAKNVSGLVACCVLQVGNTSTHLTHTLPDVFGLLMHMQWVSIVFVLTVQPADKTCGNLAVAFMSFLCAVAAKRAGVGYDNPPLDHLVRKFVSILSLMFSYSVLIKG